MKLLRKKHCSDLVESRCIFVAFLTFPSTKHKPSDTDTEWQMERAYIHRFRVDAKTPGKSHIHTTH